jgi:GTP cyclohydrolase I
MKRNKVTEARNEIERAVKRLINNIGQDTVDEVEMEKYKTTIEVEYTIKDDLFREVEVMNVFVVRDNEHLCPRLQEMIKKKLEVECDAYNRESEEYYCEGLSRKGRRDYYAWRA